MYRWGILGCGNIARQMADTLRDEPDACIAAVAARDKERAESFAAATGAKRAYSSYEELAADADLDAIYVATIHPAHYAAVRLCLEHGKAVLCEKPMTMNRPEAEELFALARERGILLMEAVWTRFLPAWREAKQLIDSGEIGQLRTVFTDFTVPVEFDPASRLFNMEKGGGALLDIGVYALHTALYIMGTEIRSLHAMGRLSPTGSDNYAGILMQTEDGVIAHISCGMDCRGDELGRFVGTKGSVVLPGLMHANRCILRLDGQPEMVREFPYKHGFSFEVREFQRLLREGKTRSEIAPPEHTLAVMGVIDETLKQIRSASAHGDSAKASSPQT